MLFLACKAAAWEKDCRVKSRCALYQRLICKLHSKPKLGTVICDHIRMSSIAWHQNRFVHCDNVPSPATISAASPMGKQPVVVCVEHSKCVRVYVRFINNATSGLNDQMASYFGAPSKAFSPLTAACWSTERARNRQPAAAAPKPCPPSPFCGLRSEPVGRALPGMRLLNRCCCRRAGTVLSCVIARCDPRRLATPIYEITSRLPLPSLRLARR